MKSMTDNQRATWQRIVAVRDVTMRRLREDYPGCNPSEWVNVDALTRIHHLDRQIIRALIKKGYLEERPSGGSGPEVRITNG